MGQAISRRILPTLERWRIREQEMLSREALEVIERQKQEAMSSRNPNTISRTLYSDPNARITGFTRGQQYQRISEEELERQIESNSKEQEINPELLQFLKDVGPMTKSINKNLTSKRVLQAANLDENKLLDENAQKNTSSRTEGLVAVGNIMSTAGPTLTDEEIAHYLVSDTSGQQLLSPILKKALETVSIPVLVLQENYVDGEDEPMYIASPISHTPKFGKIVVNG